VYAGQTRQQRKFEPPQAGTRQGRLGVGHVRTGRDGGSVRRVSNFPEKTCEIDKLVTHSRLVTAALEGRKTQQRRAGVYAYPGERFELRGVTFEVTDLRHETLADMSEEDSLAEGMDSLESYKQMILRMHEGMGWSGEMPVWLHVFARVG